VKVEDRRGELLDYAAFWIVLGIVLAVAVMRAQAYVLIAFAWFPIRWGLARAVAAARLPAAVKPKPPPVDKPFGYESGGPTS
jgi:hypothetical protein